MFCYADEVDAHSHTAPRRSWSLIGYAASEDNDNTNAFKISGVGLRKYFFRAEGLQTRSEWITIMRKSLQQDQQTTSAAAASASPATHMSGWLNKHGGSFLKTWNRRFFVLNEETATMSYYVAAEDYSRNMAPKCSLQLALYTTVAADSVHNSNAFKLSGAGCKTYHLQANSPIEQQEWICRLGRVLRSQKLYHANVSSLLIDDEEREVERFFGDAGQNPGEKVGLEHFELKTVIGRGAFGKVVLVQKKSDKKIYAMKCLSKAKLLSANQVGRVLSENRILRRIDHPYIVSMKYAFQAEAKLYLVLEFVNGGDLYWNLRAVKCFSSHQVCLYAAELVLALGHLHSLDIVHRNLKPENVLICCDGHLKLTDFGLIKENISSEVNTGSICGTPQYLAPEMLCGDEMTPTRYGKDVDWWALGVVMFEMLMGQPPFFHVHTAQMYSMILHMTVQEALDNSPQSIDVPAEFRAILHALLAKKPSDRLGFGPDDAQSVKMHPFFAPIDWQKLERREVASPYQPKVKDDTDTSIFDGRLTSQVRARASAALVALTSVSGSG
jgi:RAC serine/threonine-protein kinase